MKQRKRGYCKMNFGIFIENLGEEDISVPAYKAANKAKDLDKFEDVSLFYQNVGPCEEPKTFGLFNSTDVCHFTGTLIITFLDGLRVIKNEINNRDIYFYFTLKDQKDLFGYLECLTDDSIKIFSNQEGAEYLKTKLGREDVTVCDNLEDMVEKI